MAFVWDLTKENIYSSLGYLQGGVKYDAFIESQLTSRNSLQGLMWLVQIWSRNPPNVHETLVFLRADHFRIAEQVTRISANWVQDLEQFSDFIKGFMPERRQRVCRGLNFYWTTSPIRNTQKLRALVPNLVCVFDVV